jgi:hypothetical protein
MQMKSENMIAAWLKVHGSPKLVVRTEGDYLFVTPNESEFPLSSCLLAIDLTDDSAVVDVHGMFGKEISFADAVDKMHADMNMRAMGERNKATGTA